MSATYTAAEIEVFAGLQGCSVTEFKRRWFIAKNGSYFLHGKDGYLPPIKFSDLDMAIRQFLSLVPPTSVSPGGIDWDSQLGAGVKRKTTNELLREYGSTALEIVADLSLQHSYYDGNGHTFYEAVCPLANLAPVYHADIAEWLRLLSGSKHEKLLNWLATMKHLQSPTCALLITGKPGVGKEMLAQGLARRWARGKTPTELGRVLREFNEDLTRCPLVFCDENMPMGSNGKRVPLSDLRSHIASTSRTLARKNIANASMVGAIRLLLAANDEAMLNSSEDMTPDAQQATAERILHIRANAAAAVYLDSLGGRRATESWVAGNKIAEHVAWLEINRPVEYDKRFIVRGDSEDVGSQLVKNNKNSSLVLEWLVRFIMSGEPSNAHILVGNGAVLVNTTAVLASWTRFIDGEYAPTTTRLGTALRNLAFELRTMEWFVNGRMTQVRYHMIKTHLIYDWSLDNLIGDPDEIRRRIDQQLDVEQLKKGSGGPQNEPTQSGPSFGSTILIPNSSPKTSPNFDPTATACASGRSLFDEIGFFSKK